MCTKHNVANSSVLMFCMLGCRDAGMLMIYVVKYPLVSGSATYVYHLQFEQAICTQGPSGCRQVNRILSLLGHVCTFCAQSRTTSHHADVVIRKAAFVDDE